MLVSTSICANYLPKAMVLADSVKRINPSIKFVVCLTEQEVHPSAAGYKNFDHVVLAKDIGFDDFDSFVFKYTIVEAATAVKGQLFRYLLDTFENERKLVYLDPDILVVSEMLELDKALDDHNIVLTPHLTIPEKKENDRATLDAVMDNELCALQHGVFNLGFLAITRSQAGREFVDWWASRLSMFCYEGSIHEGIFNDQKWVDLAPCFFDVYILKHPGYNVAPWNLSMRKIVIKNSEYFVNGKRLRFFHFTGFDSGANEVMINKYIPDLTDPVYTLRNEYVQILNEHDQGGLGKLPWSYDYFLSGEKINEQSRINFRTSQTLQARYKTPFSEKNAVFKSSHITMEKFTFAKISRKLKATLRILMTKS